MYNLLLGGSLLTASVTAQQTINIASSVSPGASRPVDKSFPGLAFETSSFYSYAMKDGQPNTFSQNLISAIFSRTGGTPILRVGGTSGDHGHYDASQKDPVNFPATTTGPHFDKPYLVLGPSYFQAYNSFPNARFLFMVPHEQVYLGLQPVSNTIEWARQGLAVIGDRLDALEIGNEPDFYSQITQQKYIDSSLKIQTALQKEFPELLTDRPIFQTIDKAWNPNVGWPISAFESMNKTGAVKQVAYHFYPHGFGEVTADVLQRRIANHTQLVQSMQFIAEKVRYWNSQGRPKRILMDEVASTMSWGEGHNNLITALWSVDYQLHCAAIGVTRVHHQQIVKPGFNMWQPVQSTFSPPMVRANFYAMPFVADFLGKNPSRVNAIPLVKTDTLAAYSAWEAGKLARIAIINLEVWNQGQGARGSVDFRINDLGVSKSATINYLTAPEGGAANDTLTWGGLQWTYKSNGKGVQVKNDEKTVLVKNGVFNVAVNASSAVIIEF
ncbi:glycoside hydrolase family 79 protein [Dothistroma septosporum NZE10]|uniref:Glycoside hydrolase family 79 protein n=1 Tax=Dothistroma septosporum (strain NZE10 / CBS 128990) TaxID=675120 RepID=N1PKM4_DOTSN|nr:glycoside hydrolase family 79 protein [Dothistroma septosporum NZE10]